MLKTSIEWTQSTWNPLIGCTKVSAGCKNCYAEQIAKRFSGQKGSIFEGTTDDKGHWTGVINVNEKALLAPLKWKKSRMIFVNSMSDLFHPNVPFEVVDKIMAVIALCPQHTFQVLTKRPERMKAYFDRLLTQKPTLLECDDDDDISGITYYRDNLSAKFRVCPIGSDGLTHFKTPDNPANAVYLITNPFMDIYNAMNAVKKEHISKYVALQKEISENRLQQTTTFNLPLPNLWLGVSVENQETADTRIPILLDIPAKVRFLSCEPLLGYIDLEMIYSSCVSQMDTLRGYEYTYAGQIKTNKIDWVIVGGESGHNARPLHPDWVRSIRNQCKEANIPFFFKQWGEYYPKYTKMDIVSGAKYDIIMNSLGGSGMRTVVDYPAYPCYGFLKVGKRKAGALLDGLEYKEMPNG